MKRSQSANAHGKAIFGCHELFVLSTPGCKTGHGALMPRGDTPAPASALLHAIEHGTCKHARVIPKRCLLVQPCCSGFKKFPQPCCREALCMHRCTLLVRAGQAAQAHGIGHTQDMLRQQTTQSARPKEASMYDLQFSRHNGYSIGTCMERRMPARRHPAQLSNCQIGCETPPNGQATQVPQRLVASVLDQARCQACKGRRSWACPPQVR
jgi:hypothetical protein